MVAILLQVFVKQLYRIMPVSPHQGTPISTAKYLVQIPNITQPALRWPLQKEEQHP